MTNKTDKAAGEAVKFDGMRLDARYTGKTVLVLGAHPDDMELGVGGTIARLSKVARVIMAIVGVPSKLDIRLAEAARSAAILGAELTVLVPDACCRVEDLKTYELVGMLDALVERFQPALTLSHGPSDFHKDHTLVFNACVAMQRLASFDVLCYRPTATRPTSVGFQPELFVDISDTIDVKMDAIAAHESQFAARGLPIESFRDQARDYGRAVGVTFAEALEVSRLVFT